MQRVAVYLVGLLVSCSVAVGARAADMDRDGAEDGSPAEGSPRSGSGAARVAVLEMNTADPYVGRLRGLGYEVTTIPRTSGLEVLDDYELVVLPQTHAQPSVYAVLDSLAADYHAYVANGGRLWVGQPNPYGMPGNAADITWVPYRLRLWYAYTLDDCPPSIADSTHCLTAGLAGVQFSMPGDRVDELGDEWHVVVRGTSTGRPAVFTADYGAGTVFVELGNPEESSYCPIPTTVFRRYAECLLGPVVSVASLSWGRLKAAYRDGRSAAGSP